MTQPQRKMEFLSEAGPTVYGDVEHTAAERRKLLTMLDKMLEVQERYETLEKIVALEQIAHDLDKNCQCDTCTEVDKIRKDNA